MDIKKVLNEVTKEIEQSSSQQELQNVKVAYLGKKGKITELLKSLKDLSLEEKKSSGSKKGLSAFEKKFAAERKKQGAGGIFDFKGKKYTTNYKDEKIQEQ